MSPDTTPAAYAAILSAVTAHSGAHPDDLDIREHLRVATWILDEMASTFLMLAFANACDTCDEADTPHPDKPGPGGNYSDHPEPSDDTAEAARAAAARLYASVLGAPDGYDPAPAIVRWVEDPAGDTVARYWRDKAATVLEATARCWGHYAVMSAIGHGVSWDDDLTPLKAAQYAVQWDNGSGACGVFPERFDTEAEADAYGQAWADECNIRDFGTDDPDEDCYTAEAFDVEARELPRPGYRMGVTAEDIDWCDEHTDDGERFEVREDEAGWFVYDTEEDEVLSGGHEAGEDRASAEHRAAELNAEAAEDRAAIDADRALDARNEERQEAYERRLRAARRRSW